MTAAGDTAMLQSPVARLQAIVTGEYTSSQIRILLSPAIYLKKHGRESRFAIKRAKTMPIAE